MHSIQAFKMSLKSIALIPSSTRTPRLSPFITQYIRDLLSQQLEGSNISLTIVDLADQGLPLYDEPDIPAKLPQDHPTPHYAHAHTRTWAATIRSFDSFIFVTPQYNWSIPAALKNALDFLFHEWNGKPAAIVSYGGRGGGKAAAHLRDVLMGLRMRVVEGTVSLGTDVTMAVEATETGAVRQAWVGKWENEGAKGKTEKMFEELKSVLGA